jgi:hypothetical protein
LAAVALAAAACATASGSGAGSGRAAPALRSSSVQAGAPTAVSGFDLHKVKHVWLVVLENENEANTFGSAKKAPYLAGTLEAKGLLLKRYYGTGHNSLDNYVSLTSGQAPNADTQADCQVYADFSGGYSTTPGEPQQQAGNGCVYPTEVDDIGSQLSAANLRWRGFMEDMGNDSSRESAACGHPTVGQPDGTERAETGDGYATRHDPFVYYHRVIDDTAGCDAHVVAQGKADGAMPKAALPGERGLAWSLAKASRTPAYSFITPNLCDDGHDYPCKTGQKSRGSAGADIDHWLKTWVPKILRSPAYQKGGLVEITFDESDGPNSDSTACCHEPTDPNATGSKPGITGPGGGKVGALLISPYLKGGARSKQPFNHYSTLATDETIFGLPHLGYAKDAQTFAKVMAAHRR